MWYNQIIMEMSNEELEFVVFCIESYADTFKLDAKKVYDAIHSQNDCILKYIVKNFIVLHSQGKNFIVNDLHEIIEKKGITI